MTKGTVLVVASWTPVCFGMLCLGCVRGIHRILFSSRVISYLFQGLMAQALPPRLSFHMIECVSVHEYANAGSFLSYNTEMSILVMEDLDYPPDSLIKTQANGISV